MSLSLPAHFSAFDGEMSFPLGDFTERANGPWLCVTADGTMRASGRDRPASPGAGRMSACASFDVFLERLRAKDPEAFATLARLYSDMLMHCAKARIGAKMRAKVDPREAVQSAFRTFIRCGVTDEQQFEDWDSVFGYLATITMRKCYDKARYHKAEKRSVDREVNAYSDDGKLMFDALSREPDAVEAILSDDSIHALLATLDGLTRKVAECLMDGKSVRATAKELDLTRTTMKQQILRIRAAARKLG
jgi:RNA polymerase sigma factor (sigma-70 family)